MTVLEHAPFAAPRPRFRRLAVSVIARWLALAAILVLAGTLRFANLDALGYANHYYAAGVASMLQSWHNFFFVAAEPGGSVTIDKPPVGLWVQAASAAIFGLNTFGLLLPQIVAGLLSIVVLFHLVRRSFGTAAGLLAALALAITPVVVATDRNNTMDSTLVLALLLAAWAFVKATETNRLRWLLIGAVLVGIAFNIKMLQAYLPLPAFYALYFLGAGERWWLKLAKLTLAGIVVVATSLSWAVVVDLTPPDQRPYIGSSDNNSVMSLIVGHNGLRRLVGMRPQGGLIGSLFARPLTPTMPPGPRPGPPPNQPPFGPPGGQPPSRPPGAGGAPTPVQPAPPAGNPPNEFEIGTPGPLRLFVPPLSNEASWLLPLAIVGGLTLAVSARPRWPIVRNHQALVLWGGWLGIGAAFFSVAWLFHEYYLSLLAPAVSALAAIGAIQLWRASGRWAWPARLVLLFAATATLAFDVWTASNFLSAIPNWTLPAVALLIVGGLLLLAALVVRRQLLGAIGFAAALGALLLTPAIWSGFTTAYASGNQSLPSAYSGRPSGPLNRGRVNVNQALLDYLQARTQGMTYLMAVPSAMQGADYVLATGRPVLYLGGFSGQDRVVTAERLARLVAEGKLRFISYGTAGPGGPGGGTAEIATWITRNCRQVTGVNFTINNVRPPNGTAPGGTPGTLPISLYDCAGTP
ncbi:MAG: hypothetical protein KatS3mg060_2918 [Dehalococcoidia bacterium]|nr:MAG: hypothetical protein KatS3mg060_2918 [Dehalococcoidia bacterium]